MPAGKKCEAVLEIAVTDRNRNNPIPFNYETVHGGEAEKDDTNATAAWLSDAVIYLWDDEFGDVGEPNPELEKVLFEDENIQRAGGAIKALSYEVITEGPEKIHPVREVCDPNPGYPSCLLTMFKFDDAGLHPVMLENVKLCRYAAPTPIQSYCIPAVLTGHDVVAIAQTGMPCFKNNSFSYTDFVSRLGKDCCLPGSYPVQAYGQGSPARRSAAQPFALQPAHRPRPR